MTCHSVEDPFEALIIGYNVLESQASKKKDYARLLNASTTYIQKQSPKEVLNIEVNAS